MDTEKNKIPVPSIQMAILSFNPDLDEYTSPIIINPMERIIWY